jgi:DNA modification methylase
VVIKCIDQFITDRTALYHGDSVEILKAMPDNSAHYMVFSPPFASLYTYSNS